MTRLDVAFIAGHSKDSHGAVDLVGCNEREWTGDAVERDAAACRLIGLTAEVFYRSDTIKGYEAKMRDLADRVNLANPRLAVSRHFNAVKVPTPSDNGVVGLHWPGSEKGLEATTVLCNAIAGAQGTRVKNVRGQKDSWSGVPLWILRLLRAPTALLESHFGTDIDDVLSATAARDSGATSYALAEALRDLFLGWN